MTEKAKKVTRQASDAVMSWHSVRAGMGVVLSALVATWCCSRIDDDGDWFALLGFVQAVFVSLRVDHGRRFLVLAIDGNSKVIFPTWLS